MSRRRPPLAGLIVALVAGVVVAALVPPALYAVLNHGLHPASAAATGTETEAPASSPATTTALPSVTTATTAPPATADPGRVEAQAIAALVTKSGTARKQVIDAVNGVSNCTVDPADGENAMTAAADTRQQVLDGIAALPKGLPEEPVVVPPLEEAMRQSIDANHAFGKWMTFVITVGCNNGRAPTNEDFAQANAASARATAAKKTFVAAWKPVAARYNLPAVTETDL